MTSLPNHLYEERTPLLIGVEGLGSPQAVINEVDGRGIRENLIIGSPCIKHGLGSDYEDTVALQKTNRAKRKLIIACIICLIFLIGEFVGKVYHLFIHNNNTYIAVMIM